MNKKQFNIHFYDYVIERNIDFLRTFEHFVPCLNNQHFHFNNDNFHVHDNFRLKVNLNFLKHQSRVEVTNYEQNMHCDFLNNLFLNYDFSFFNYVVF